MQVRSARVNTLPGVAADTVLARVAPTSAPAKVLAYGVQRAEVAQAAVTVPRPPPLVKATWQLAVRQVRQVLKASSRA